MKFKYCKKQKYSYCKVAVVVVMTGVFLGVVYFTSGLTIKDGFAQVFAKITKSHTGNNVKNTDEYGGNKQDRFYSDKNIASVFLINKTPNKMKDEDQTQKIIKQMQPVEVFEIIKKDKNKDSKEVVVLDARTQQEYLAGHLDNALNIDFLAHSIDVSLEKLDKNKTYIVYCQSGQRSGEMSKIMSRMGFASVYNMQGGIIQWNIDGFKIIQ